MAQSGKETLYEVTIPTDKLPVNRVDTQTLTRTGHVKTGDSSSLGAICGFVKGVRASKFPGARDGETRAALAVMFQLYSDSAAGRQIAADVEMGAANYQGYLEGKINDTAAELTGLVLRVGGVSASDPHDGSEIVNVVRL